MSKKYVVKDEEYNMVLEGLEKELSVFKYKYSLVSKEKFKFIKDKENLFEEVWVVFIEYILLYVCIVKYKLECLFFFKEIFYVFSLCMIKDVNR